MPAIGPEDPIRSMLWLIAAEGLRGLGLAATPGASAAFGPWNNSSPSVLSIQFTMLSGTSWKDWENGVPNFSGIHTVFPPDGAAQARRGTRRRLQCYVCARLSSLLLPR